MEVIKLTDKKVRCDTIGCRGMARYALTVNGGRRTFICEACANAVYEAVAADVVPESPTSIFLKKEKTVSKKAVKGDK